MNQEQERHYSDEELARMSLTDRWRFALLVDRYEKPLRRYIARLGSFVPEDLDDLLQNIFMKVYENLNGFDARLKFSSWIYRIAHNEVVSHFRHKSARPQGHVADIGEEALFELVGDMNVLEEREQEEAHDALIRAIALLPEAYREVVILKYFEYKSYDEISDILLLPPGTVATRLNRAKERLRAIMSSNGYDHE